jgi:hypothetical protein
MKLPQKDKLVKDRLNGLSYREIAKKYGATYDGVRNAIQRDPNPKEARISGMPPLHITETLLKRGLSPSVIRKMFTYKRTKSGRIKKYLRKSIELV